MMINRTPLSERLRFCGAAVPLIDVFGFLLFFGGYMALVAWFRLVDVYHSHFSDVGLLILFNNLFRVLFIFYLFWIIQVVGAASLRLYAERNLKLSILDYLLLTFFVGTGLLHVVLLALGYLRLLNADLMVILTAPVVALAYFELRLAVPKLRLIIYRLVFGGSRHFRAIGILLVVVWCALLLVKGLYPGGGHDYYTHYFYSYLAVLEHRGVWPNEVWYHYFYSKGAGLFFLGMLLTDPLAPQLVTFCMISVTGLAIFVFLRRLASHTTWPLIGVILFFGTFIYSPGWGEFQKLHEFNTVFVITILCMMVVALDDPVRTRTIWLMAGASAMIAAIIVNPDIGFFLGTVFGAVAVHYLIKRDQRRSLACFGFATLAGALVAGILIINFITTGLANDQGIMHFWKFADVEKLYRWGALPNVLSLYWGMTGLDADSVPLAHSFKFLVQSSRLDLLWPLFGGGLLAAGIWVYQANRAGGIAPRPLSFSSIVFMTAILVFVALALIAGRAQRDSFYRFSAFMVPVLIVAGIAMWNLPILSSLSWAATILKYPRTPAIVVVLCTVTILYETRLHRVIALLSRNALEHAIGTLSIDDAYVRRSDGGFILPGGAIYPGARGAYAVVGPNTLIWSLHATSYCMLPDCKMMSFMSFLMTRSWDRVMWGPPEDGEKLLRAAGLNYFLFSRELPIHDPLPLSPLFSAENIAQHFGIRWTDGTTTLLTWSGPDTTALDQAWLAKYRRAVAASPAVSSFPNTEMKAIFDRLYATPHPWRSFDLPWKME